MNSCKILVTGSNGFLGQTLQTSHAEINPKGKSFTFLSRAHLDLLNFTQVKAYLESEKFEVVINFASARVSGIAGDMNNYETYFENSAINKNIAQCSLLSGVDKFINIGSSSIYPPSNNPIPEEQLLMGDPDPGNLYYSLSKLSFTRFLAEVDKNKKLHYKSLIVPNLFGPGGGRSPDQSHLINAIFHKMKQFKKGEINEVEIWGNGKARREFLYARNVTDFIIEEVINNLENFPSVLNIGENEDYEILDYYNIIADLFSVEPRYKFLNDKPVGAMRKLLDSSLSLNLNWNPSIKTIKGIKKLYEYEKHLY